MARIILIATGGTIASRVELESGSAVPAVSAEELVTGVPGLSEVAELETVEFALVNSWDITPPMMGDLARLIARVVADRAPHGVIVTHGTDTMEETAFALDVLLELDVPVVLTGAMRPADAPGADGPRNLLAAAQVATSEDASGAGVMVVMNDEIHAARYVTKTHTTALGTFASPDTGALGTVDHRGVLFRWRPVPAPRVPIADPEGSVVLVKMVAGLDQRVLRRPLEDGARGMVIEGSGSGNLPAGCQPAVRALVEADVPVVLTSRCGAGRVVPAYGGEGGGATLLDLGVISAGDLPGPKARLALMFLLGGGADVGSVRSWFEQLA